MASPMVLLGDLNWDMLKPSENVLQQFDSLNLHQIIIHPTRYDPNTTDKATLILVCFVMSLVITVLLLVFCKGHSIKLPGQINQKRILENFNTQAFLHDLAQMDWDRVSLIPTVNDA